METSWHRSQWRALFDGKGTQGWEMVGPGELKLENGELVTVKYSSDPQDAEAFLDEDRKPRALILAASQGEAQ